LTALDQPERLGADDRLGRRAMVATLGLAGFRISELMDLRVGQVDLIRSRFKLADAKTEAGVRDVEISLYLRDELLDHAMDRRARGLPFGPSDHFFGTATGKRRDPDRFRDRILARAVERASSNRAQTGLAPLPEITPRSLRRTWATFAAMIGRDPKWIAAQIGHVSPAFTFSVYQQVATGPTARPRRSPNGERIAVIPGRPDRTTGHRYRSDQCWIHEFRALCGPF
jgi:integrase